MDLTVSLEALRYAAGRVKAFAQVNLDRSRQDKVESINLFWQSVGVTPERLEDFYAFAEGIVEDPRSQGPFMLGVAYGLFVREFDAA